MRKLPNGVIIFNSTPHPVRFWEPGWEAPIEVPPDEVINAKISEVVVEEKHLPGGTVITFVTPSFVPTVEGLRVINRALLDGADVIVGSLLAAQAYPGQVAAMVVLGVGRQAGQRPGEGRGEVVT